MNRCEPLPAKGLALFQFQHPLTKFDQKYGGQAIGRSEFLNFEPGFENTLLGHNCIKVSDNFRINHRFPFILKLKFSNDR